jgi:3-methyladenine DNA glycosylase Mpg
MPHCGYTKDFTCATCIAPTRQSVMRFITINSSNPGGTLIRSAEVPGYNEVVGQERQEHTHHPSLAAGNAAKTKGMRILPYIATDETPQHPMCGKTATGLLPRE